MKKFTTIAILVVALLAAIGLGVGLGCAPAPPAQASIVGMITEIDTIAAEVTITPEEGEAVTLTITAETSITKDGIDATIDDLEVGNGISATYRLDSMEAVELEVTSASASVEGVIEAVDTAAGEVTIAPEEGESVILTVTGGTTITRDGADAAVEELEAGDSVIASYNAVTMEAVEIVAESAE